LLALQSRCRTCSSNVRQVRRAVARSHRTSRARSRPAHLRVPRVRSLDYRGREVQIASGVFRSGLPDRAIAWRVSATVGRAMTTVLVSLLLHTPTLFDGNV